MGRALSDKLQTTATDRLLSGVDFEAVCQGGLQGLVVVASQFQDRVVRLRHLVWNHAKHMSLCLWFPLTDQLDMCWTSIEDADMESPAGVGREQSAYRGDTSQTHIRCLDTSVYTQLKKQL